MRRRVLWVQQASASGQPRARTLSSAQYSAEVPDVAIGCTKAAILNTFRFRNGIIHDPSQRSRGLLNLSLKTFEELKAKHLDPPMLTGNRAWSNRSIEHFIRPLEHHPDRRNYCSRTGERVPLPAFRFFEYFLRRYMRLCFAPNSLPYCDVSMKNLDPSWDHDHYDFFISLAIFADDDVEGRVPHNPDYPRRMAS